MAGNKIFYVTRTEDESTQTAGAATRTRADKPQLLKIVPIDNAGNPDPATPEDNQIYATEEENQEILFVSDTVQAGDYNPVTSDAVFNYAKPPRPDWANAEAVSISSSNPTWTATKDGILVGYLDYSNTQGDVTLSQNGVLIALARFHNSSGHYYAFTATISAQVRAGDAFTLSTSVASTQSAIKFIPYI